MRQLHSHTSAVKLPLDQAHHQSFFLVHWLLSYVPSGTDPTSLDTNGTQLVREATDTTKQPLQTAPPTWPRLKLGIQAVMRAPPLPPRRKGHQSGGHPHCVTQMRMLSMNPPVSAKVAMPGGLPINWADQRHSAPPSKPASAVNKPVPRTPTR